MNSFKVLEDELVREQEDRLKRVSHNINYSRSLFQTIGDVIDLYVPKLGEVMISMSGNQQKSKANPEKPNKYPHEG